jgi:hypothetical protein
MMAVLAGIAVLLLVAWRRGAEYDEAYTIGIAAGHRLPVWPGGVFTAATGQAWLMGASTAGGIAEALRLDDVHPPLYFWAVALWRAVLGSGWFTTRLFSVAAGSVSLILVARVALRTARPAGLAVLLSGLTYGVAYTGGIARGFALAQGLLLAGTLLLLRRRALAAGWALGLAIFTNYLAGFGAGAAVGWLLAGRRWADAARLGLGVCPLLAASLYFYLAQRGARPLQFPAFAWAPVLQSLARDQMAALFGGLPLYAGALAPVVALGVTGLAMSLAVIAARDGPRDRAALLFLLQACAPAAGLLVLARLSGTAPIEIRYLSFSLPPLALLVAPVLAARPRLRTVTLAVQAAAVAGLLLAPATMQPQTAAARAAAGFHASILIPRGNDGAGIPLPVMASLPGSAAVRVIAGPPPLDDATRLVLLRLGLDDESRRTLQAASLALTEAGWHRAAAKDLAELWERR